MKKKYLKSIQIQTYSNTAYEKWPNISGWADKQQSNKNNNKKNIKICIHSAAMLTDTDENFIYISSKIGV